MTVIVVVVFTLVDPVACLDTSATALNGSWSKWTTNPFSTDGAPRRTTPLGTYTTRWEEDNGAGAWVGSVGVR